MYLGPPKPLIVTGLILLVLGLIGLLIVHSLRRSLQEGTDFRMFKLRNILQWVKIDSMMSIAITASVLGGSMLVMGFIARWLGN